MRRGALIRWAVCGLLVIGCLGMVSQATAAQTRESKVGTRKQDEKKSSSKLGDKKEAPDAKAGKEEGAAEGEKKAVTELTANQEKMLESMEKQYPKVAEAKQRVLDLQADLGKLGAVEGTRERKKAEQETAKVQKKLDGAVADLDKEAQKAKDVLLKERDKLKDQEAVLQAKIEAQEAKKKNTEKLNQEMDLLKPKLGGLDDRIVVLEYMGSVPEPEEK